MKQAALAALLLLLVPLQAAALDTTELLGYVAMPLAVAAVSDATGVPAGDLSHFVATLNRAQVPPTQVVQVIRYAPAAIVVEQQPAFVDYVDQQVDQGIVGDRLVTVIENRYRTYDLEPQVVTLQEPATTYVVRDDYVPPVVVTRVTEYRPAYVARDTNDLLALVAMPLAVAAVSNLSGVPMNDLTDLVATLNAANVPPVQVVEVLRYAPVALVTYDNQPRFSQYVRTEYDRGITGPALVTVIDQRLRDYDVTPRFDVVQPVRIVEDDDEFFPPVVRTRIAETREHPHGGPPGQLKKQLGLQTGAEVVHGTLPRTERRERVARVTTDARPAKQHVRETKRAARPKVERREVARPRVERRHVEHHVERPRAAERSQRVERPRAQRVQRVKPQRMHGGGGGGGRGHAAAGGGGGHGHGGGKGKGKGKG